MTMAYATLTGPITLPGSDIGVRARIIATPLTTDQLLTYTGDDRFTAGPVVGETNGVGALNGMKVPTNSDLPGLLWQITAERLDKGPGPAKWTIKHAVAITGTGTIKLRDLVEVDVLTVDSTLVASVSDLAAAADASKTAAAGSATTAAGWADAAASSAADADTSADLADTSADTATTAANTATTKATEASTSATTATTKASEAAASASHAEDMAGAAEAVAVSNDTIIAGRINDSASATAAALTASIADTATDPAGDVVAFNDTRYQTRDTRRSVVSTGAGTSVVSTFPSKALYRMLYRIPRTAQTVRFRYQNYNAVTDTIGAQDVTLNVAVGVPAYDSTTGQPTGNFDTSTVAATQQVTNQALAGGAAPWYSPDIPVASLPGKPGEMILVSFHVATATGSGSRSWMRSNVPMWWKNEALSTELITGSVTAGSTSPPLGDFSVVADCEAEDAILFVGDSYSDGYGDVAVNTIGGTHLSVPARLADLTGLPVASTAVSGGLVQYFAERGDTSPIWEKVDFANAEYTAAVILSHPNNDTGSGRTIAQIKADYLTVLGKLRAKGIGRILAVTIPPRSNTAGVLGSGVAAGANTFTGDYNITSGTAQVGTDGKIETVTVTGSSGTGPYTMTISGTFAQAHSSGEVYAKTTDNEAKRQAFNYWVRSRPGGIVDVIDLDAIYRDPANVRALLASKAFDVVHLNGTEYDNVARLIKAALIA